MGQARGRRRRADANVAGCRAVAAVIVPLVILSACASPSAPTINYTPVTPYVPPRVAIISIDGLRPDALSQASTPVIMALAAYGASSLRAQTTNLPVTLPAHTSMLSGYSQEQHAIDWDEWNAARGFITRPTLLSAASAAGRSCAMVVGKEKLKHLNPPTNSCRFVLTANAKDDDVAAAAAGLAAQEFDLLFIHLPQTDLTGHASAWMAQTYLTQVSQTDTAVGRILAALPPNTTVILTADHGGHANTHGARVATDLTIPWIISGPGVRTGYVIGSAVSVKDTAATAARILGLTLPADVEGRVVAEAFATPAGSALASRFQPDLAADRAPLAAGNLCSPSGKLVGTFVKPGSEARCR